MKAKKFNKKLVLSKMTVANLSNNEKGMVLGGGGASFYTDCQSICIQHCPTEPIDKPETGLYCYTTSPVCDGFPFDPETSWC